MLNPAFYLVAARASSVTESMAECPENSSTSATGEDETAADSSAAPGLVLGQSKSKSESFREFGELDAETVGAEKNAVFLVCRSCRCKVLKPGYGTLVEREVKRQPHP